MPCQRAATRKDHGPRNVTGPAIKLAVDEVGDAPEKKPDGRGRGQQVGEMKEWNGALAGEQVGKQREARESAERDAAEARRELENQRSQEQRPARTAATYPQGQYKADPTVGEFANNTRWMVKVYVDAPTNNFNNIPQLALAPYETVPANLDVGEHRVSAVASVKTQFGERTVGKYEKIIQVDSRGEGWRISFDETSFN